MTTEIQQEIITIDNFFIKSKGVWQEIEELPSGLIENFVSKKSKYWTNPEQTVIYRSSDHWGHSIRDCAWFLRMIQKKRKGQSSRGQGYHIMSSYLWKRFYGSQKRIGMISVSDLRPNNPEWWKLSTAEQNKIKQERAAQP